MKNKIFVIVTSLLLCSSQLYSQDPIIVSISSKGISSLPADRIHFRIDLSTEDDEYQIAFNTHKKLLKELTDIQNQFNFPDSTIKFSLFHINKHTRRDRTNSDKLYHTNHRVFLDLTDINIYEDLQYALISKGIDSFSAKYVSSKSSTGIELATKNAIQDSENKIRTIVEELGKTKYTFLEIEVGQQYINTSGEIFEFSSPQIRNTIEEIPQLVNFQIDIKVKYQLN
jgi:hypothetical protein